MPSTPPHGLVGQTLAGRYLLLREIGRGGMAAVYEAKHVEIGKRVAIKVLSSDLLGSPTVVERFIREARAAAAIESPNICGVHDVGRLDDGRPFMVLDLLKGEDLFARMNRAPQSHPVDTVRIFSQVARGLAKAHEAGIVHRDLKPENIFLATDDDGDETVKILDFGLARFFVSSEGGAEQRLTREGMLFGTPLYMSPEQVTREGKVDHRVDLWAVGCMVFESLTGKSVWDDTQGVAMVLAQVAAKPLPVPSSLRGDLPTAFDAWFAKALDRNPDKRFQNAKELAFALALSLGVDPTRLPQGFSPSMMGTPLDGPVVAMLLRSVPEPADAPARAETLAASLEGAAPKARAHSRRGWLAMAAFGILALAGVAVFAVWAVRRTAATHGNMLFVSEAGPTASAAAASASASPAPEVPSAIGSAAALPEWATTIRQAQETLSNGDVAEALKGFERAAEQKELGPTHMMLDHFRVASASTGACKLTGLGRPRPADWASAAKHGPVIATGAGMLATWTDEHRGSGQTGVTAALLDSALRSGTTIDLSDENAKVAGSNLVAYGGKGVLVYDDGAATPPGIFLRTLDPRGNTSAIPIRLSETRSSDGRPSVAVTEAGDFWAVWADDPDRKTANIYARRVDKSLTVTGPAVQVTRLAGAYGPVGARALAPVASISGGRLVIAYRVERGRQHEIVFQSIALTDPQLVGGVPPWGRRPADLAVGTVHRITPSRMKVNPPGMACAASQCLVAWRSESTGSTVAEVESATGKVKWLKVVAPRGTQTGVGVDSSGHGLVAWHEDGRVRIAVVSSKGIGATSILGRVHGEQPAPTVTWSADSWIVAWTTFESGHPEPYLARVRCH